MKFLYVTDLHGWQEGYEELLRFAEKVGAEAIINGGDMLPKGNNLLEAQKSFIQTYLPDYFRRCRASGIRFYGMFGNDDLASGLPYWLEIIAQFECVHDLTEDWHELPQGYTIHGVNYVPDAPFGLKDWMVLDSPGWSRPLQTCRPIMSGPNGFEEIKDPERFFAERPTLTDVLDETTADALEMSKTIWVIHAPPFGTGLGILGGILRGKDVGSPAVRDWIERNQPMLTLHGHVHESPEISGVHTVRLGRTICHQPGQKAQLALTTSIIEVQNTTVEIERRLLLV